MGRARVTLLFPSSAFTSPFLSVPHILPQTSACVLVLTEYVCVCIFNSASVTRKEKHMFLVSVKHLSSWSVYHWIAQFLVFLLKVWPVYPCWSFFGLLSKTFALIQAQPCIAMHISLPNAWLNSAFSLFCLKSTGGHQNCYISNINHVSSCRT